MRAEARSLFRTSARVRIGLICLLFWFYYNRFLLCFVRVAQKWRLCDDVDRKFVLGTAPMCLKYGGAFFLRLPCCSRSGNRVILFVGCARRSPTLASDTPRATAARKRGAAHVVRMGKKRFIGKFLSAYIIYAFLQMPSVHRADNYRSTAQDSSPSQQDSFRSMRSRDYRRALQPSRSVPSA